MNTASNTRLRLTTQVGQAHVATGVLLDLVLTVNSCIKVRLDLQADKSLVVVKDPFFPRVVNPR
jgi:hypothetical protein